jgi:hypothetical protein
VTGASTLRVLYTVLAAAVLLMCVVSYHQQPAVSGHAAPAPDAAGRLVHSDQAAASGSATMCAGQEDTAACQNSTAAVVQEP